MAELGWSEIWNVARDSIARPREVTRRLIAADLSPVWLWQALILMAIFAGLLAWGELALIPSENPGFDPSLLPGPVAMAAMQFALLSILVPVVHGAGRIFGGTGDIQGAMKVVVWWQGLTLVLQVAELIAMLLLPFLSVVIVIATFAAMVWVLTNAVAELHGFRSLGLVLLGMIVVGALLVVALSILFSALGVGLVGGV